MQNGLGQWLKDNGWTLFITSIAIAMAWATLSARVQALETKVVEYPSQDWFELKFEQIEDKIDKNTSKIEGIESSLQTHVIGK